MSKKPVLGGWVICRPAPLVYDGKSWQGFTLISDCHLGAPTTNHKLIIKELEYARAHNDRVAINGDVFDGIVVSDPRFVADILHPDLQARPDLLNAVVDMAADIFGPYADLIDVIGCGNHETKVLKNSQIDLTTLLIDRLKACLPKSLKDSHVIHHGGYAGYIDYRFVYKGSGRPSDATRGKRYLISYYHGGGGGAGQNKGMGDFHKRMWVRCDLMWLGHKHCATINKGATMECPTVGFDPIIRERRNVMTSAYGITYSGQTQKSISKNGRRSCWASDDKGFAPEGLGGARVEVKMHPRILIPEVRVIQ